jgi:hypothetical protein
VKPVHDFRDPSVPLTQQQAEIRRLVYKEISANPGTFDMESWEIPLEWLNDFDREAMGLQHLDECGTARCVSGWAQFFGGVTYIGCAGKFENENRGITLMGLTEAEYYSLFSGELFYDTNANAVERMRVIAEAAK